MPVNIIERDSSFGNILHENGYLTSNFYPSQKEIVFQRYLYGSKQSSLIDINPTWGVYQNVTSTPVMWPNNSTEEEDIIENENATLPMLSEPGTVKRTSSLQSHSYYNCLQVYNKYTAYDSEKFDYRDKIVIWQIYGKHLKEVKFHVDVATALQLHIFSRRLTFPSFHLTGPSDIKTKDSLKRLDCMLTFHDKLANESFLRGKIRVCLALEYARKNKLGKAYRYLEEAGQYLAQTEASEFRAWYHLASACIYNALRKVSQAGSSKRLPVVFKHLENARADFLKEQQNGSCFKLESTLILWWMFTVKSGLIDLVAPNCNTKKIDLEELNENLPTKEDIHDAHNLYKRFMSEVEETSLFQTQEIEEFQGNMTLVLKDLNALVNPPKRRMRKSSEGSSPVGISKEDEIDLLPELSEDTIGQNTSDFTADDVPVTTKKTKRSKRHHQHVCTPEEMLAEFRAETNRQSIPPFIYFHHLEGKLINLVVEKGAKDQTIAYLINACPKLYNLGMIKISEQTWSFATNKKSASKATGCKLQNQDKANGKTKSEVISMHSHAAGEFTSRTIYGQKTTAFSPGSEFFPVPSKDVVNVVGNGQVHIEMDIDRKLGVPVTHYGTIGGFVVDEQKGKIYAITSQHNIDKSKYGYHETNNEMNTASGSGAIAKMQTTWMSQINNKVDLENSSRPDVFVLGTKICGILQDKQSFLKSGKKDMNPEISTTNRQRRHSGSSKTPMVYDIAAVEMEDILYMKDYFQPFFNTQEQNFPFVMPKSNPIVLDTNVQKIGATTGYTTGYVCSTDIYWNNESNWYGGCFMITSDVDVHGGDKKQIAYYGDSGAIVSTLVGDDQTTTTALGIVHKVDEKGYYAVCVNFKMNLEELIKQSGINLELLSPEILDKLKSQPNAETTKVQEVSLTDSGYCDTDTSYPEASLPSSEFDDSGFM